MLGFPWKGGIWGGVYMVHMVHGEGGRGDGEWGHGEGECGEGGGGNGERCYDRTACTIRLDLRRLVTRLYLDELILGAL